MPRRSAAGNWFANQLWNTSLPWLAVVAFGMVGFYFLTNAKLDRHDEQLVKLETAISQQKTAVIEARRQDNAEREKARDAFLADSKATAAGIAELNKQTAVTSVQLQAIAAELVKIASRLDNLKGR